MFFKKFDNLSPPITLYFKGENNHSSIFSGVLTIISYILVLSFSVYYILEYKNKANPSIYYYTRYTEDNGAFPLNSSSLFHFIKFSDKKIGGFINIDFESVRIFGFSSSLDDYIDNKNLSQYNHWLYGPCNNNDIKNLEDIINNIEFPEKSVCIRKFFDINTQKYYNTSEQLFKWPELLHGLDNDKGVNYKIIIEKCNNDSLQIKCKSDYEIESYLNSFKIFLYFVDNYEEVSNYLRPINKYLYKLTDEFFLYGFTINNIYFNPLVITDNNAIFIKNAKKSYISYEYDDKEINNTLIFDENIGYCFNFLMTNFVINYERNYQSFQDLLSNIGGINSFATIICSIINSFIYNFIILLDTEELVLNIDKYNFKKTKLSQKPALLKKASEVLNPPKLKSNKKTNITNSINNKYHSSNLHILIKEKMHILNPNNKNNNDSKSEPYNIIFLNRNQKFNLNKKNSSKNSKISFIDNNSNKIENSIKSDIDYKSRNMNNKETIKNFETENQNELSKPLKKQNFTFYNYVFYLISCKLNNPKIYYYETFRKEVISEENLIQNYINIFKMLRVCNIENLDPFRLNNYNQDIC